MSAPGGDFRNNSFSRDPPLSDQGEVIIGVYLLLLGWLSWFGNSLVLFVLLRQRVVLVPSEVLTVNLAVSDASIAVFGYSRGILEVFNLSQHSHLFISTIWTCQVDGFLTLLFGLSSINTLTVISVWRYIKGCHPERGWVGLRSTLVSLVLVWTMSAFWSGAPLFGWGRYRDRGYGTCEVDWSQATWSPVARSYMVSVLVTQFLVPVLVMVFCYVSIIRTVKRGIALSGPCGDQSERQKRTERDVTIVSMVICTAFILAWSPYAVLSLWSSLGLPVPPLTSIFTRLFAKSASFYNPLIYFGLNSKFRRDVVLLLPCVKTTPRPRPRPRPRPETRPKTRLRPEHKHHDPPNPYPAQESHLPQDRAPTFHLPQDRAPTFHLPQDRAPTFHLPQDRAPTSYQPQDRAPTSHLPQDRAPTVHLPQDRAPTSHLPQDRAPTVHLPQDRAPTFHLPQDRAPTFHLPQDRAPTSYQPQDRAPTSYLPQDRAPTVHLPQDRAPTSHLPQDRAPTFHLPQDRAPTSHLPQAGLPLPASPLSLHSPPSHTDSGFECARL